MQLTNRIKAFFRIALGVTLIVVGIIGLFLPFIQGIVCIIAGAFLLGRKEQYLALLAQAKRRSKAIIKRVKGWF